MVSMMYVLFIAIVVPLTLMLLLLDKKSRTTFLFFIIGIVMCLFVSEINSVMLSLFGNNMHYVTTTITPLTEEFVKSLPIIYFAFVVSEDRSKLLSLSMAVGIGFAVFENIYILTNSIGEISYFLAIIRGFGSGLMHGICTAVIGYGMSYIRSRPKLFYTGIFGLYIIAVTYHAVYNTLMQSNYYYIGLIMPIVTYIALMFSFRWKKKEIEHDG